jgi:hypothetical protein
MNRFTGFFIVLDDRRISFLPSKLVTVFADKLPSQHQKPNSIAILATP